MYRRQVFQHLNPVGVVSYHQIKISNSIFSTVYIYSTCLPELCEGAESVSVVDDDGTLAAPVHVFQIYTEQ